MPSLIEIRLLENPTYTYAQCVVAARQLLAVHRDGFGLVASEKAAIKSARIGNSEERSSLAMAGHSNRDDSRSARPRFNGRNENPAVNRGGPRADKDTRSCYNCGKVGHIARDCRLPRRSASRQDAPGPAQQATTCQICSRVGHTALNCYKRYDQPGGRKFQQSKPPSGMASTGEYRLRAQVNGTSMRLLVDTGASHSYMSWTTYMKNFKQVPTRNPPAELKSTKVANGDKMPTRAVVNLQMAVGRKSVTQQFLLVNHLGTDAILGTDFYNDHVRSIHLKDRTVEFDDGQVLEMDFVPAVEVSNRLIVAEAVTVGARSKTYLPVKLRSDCHHGRDLLVVNPNAFYDRYGLLIPYTVYSSQNKTKLLRIINPSSEAIKLTKNAVVCELEACETVNKALSGPRCPSVAHGVLSGQMHSALAENGQDESEPSPTRGESKIITAEMVKTDSNLLDRDDKVQLDDLLHDYSDVFAVDGSKPGRTSMVQHRIDLVTGARPFKQPFRRVPLHLQDELDRQVDEMLEQGVIEPSTVIGRPVPRLL